MSDVRGRFAIDVQFWDRTSAEGLQSLKTIALQDSTEYTTGKVAIVSGTLGTAALTLTVDSIYENASGSLVDFATVDRFAFRGNPGVRLFSGFTFFGASKNNQVAICDNVGNPPVMTFIQLQGIQTAGTASYTLVLYGT